MDRGEVVATHNRRSTNESGMNLISSRAKLARLLQGGTVIEVTNTEEAKIAEEAGASSVVLSHPSYVDEFFMVDPSLILEMKQEISIPIIARARIGHVVEAQVLEAVGVDFVEESECLEDADGLYINKHKFQVPFACGCRTLEEALERVREGAAMLWILGGLSRDDTHQRNELFDTVQNVKLMMRKIAYLSSVNENEVLAVSIKMELPYDLIAAIKEMGRLPVVQFAAGGIVTPADAAFMMRLGCDGIVVGKKIFSLPNPRKRIRALVQAVIHWNDPHILAEASFRLDHASGDDMTN